MNSRLKMRIAFLLVLAVFVSPCVLQIAAAQPMLPPGMRGDYPMYYTVKSVLSTLNTILLLILLAIYVSAYRETRSEFLVGLIIFDLAMLFYAVSSNPFVQAHFGFRAVGLGPFAMLPDLFSLTAVIVLLVHAFRYR